jgi:predicted esterase
VEGFADAVTVIPVGVTHPAPLVVAVLGIGDTPEEQCAAWKDLVGNRAFVLCPRGLPNWVRPEATETTTDEDNADKEEKTIDEDASVVVDAAAKQVGFYMPDLGRLEGEVLAGVAALEKRWGKYVADQEVVYAGFSRGAFLGAQLVAKKPDRFKRAVLIEGGHSPWTDETAAAFARGGGNRVLFVCGRQECLDDAAAATATLTRQKVETRTVFGQEGHGYKKQVKDETRRALDFVFAP